MYLLFFIILSISEVYIFIKLFAFIGFLKTLAIIILTGIIGIKLMKSQGKGVIKEAGIKLSKNQVPSESIAEGFLILISGILLVTPGIITDITGFALLIPPIRRIAARALMKKFKNKFQIMNFSPFGNGTTSPSDNGVIDVDWEE